MGQVREAAITQPSGRGNGAAAVRRRRAVPNGRAAVGGLLVALAAGIALAAYTDAASRPLERYVVARRALAIGERLTPDDLTTSAMHLPPGSLRERVFASIRQVAGAVVVASVGPGELIQASAVVASGGEPGERQMSVPVESARAVGGRLRPGEMVDVLATFGTGTDAYTVVVVAGARVVNRDESGGPLGDRRGEVVTLALARADDAVALAHALAAGQVSLVRTSGAAPAGPATYRPPPPDSSQ